MPTLEDDLRRYLAALTEEVDGRGDGSEPRVPTAGGTRRFGPVHLAVLGAAAVLVAVALGVWLLPGDDAVDVTTSAASTTTEDPRISTTPTTTDALESDGGSWTELAVIVPRDSHAELIWTGDRLLGVFPENHGDDVAIQVWSPDLSEVRAAAPSGLVWRAFPMIVWTGSEVLVMGGSNGPGLDRYGAAYDPKLDRWRSITPPPGFDPVSPVSGMGAGAWTGSEVVVWDQALAYDPAGDRWRAIAPTVLGERARAAVVAMEGRLLVWGGCPAVVTDETCENDGLGFDDGAVYDPLTDTWSLLPDGGPTPGAETHAVEVEGGVLVVSGRLGTSAPEGRSVSVALFDLDRGTWRQVDAPEGTYGPLFDVVAVPGGVALVGGGGPVALLDLDRERWRQLGILLVPAGGTAAWTGGALVVTGTGRTLAYR